MYKNNNNIEYPALDKQDPYQNEIDYFIDCVFKGEKINRVPSEEAVNALYLSSKSKESIESNMELKL